MESINSGFLKFWQLQGAEKQTEYYTFAKIPSEFLLPATIL